MFSNHAPIWNYRRNHQLQFRDARFEEPDVPDVLACANYNMFGFDSNKTITTDYDSNAVLDKNMTCSIWAYQDIETFGEGIFSQKESTYGWGIINNGSSNHRFYINNHRISASVTLGQLNHLVGTYDGSTMKFYVNGVEVASEAETESISDLDTLTVEVGRYAGSDSLSFTGSLTHPLLMNRAIDPSEVSVLYNGGDIPYHASLPTTITDDVIWGIKASSENNPLADLSGNGSISTANNGATSDGQSVQFCPYEAPVNLLTNGDFSQGADGLDDWNTANPVVGGKLFINGGTNFLERDGSTGLVDFEQGATYRITMDLSNVTSTGSLRVLFGGANSESQGYPAGTTSDGQYTIEVTATSPSGTSNWLLQAASALFVGEIDNIVMTKIS